MTTPPGPAPIWEVINGFAGYWALHAAVDLDLFDLLVVAPRSTAWLADAVGIGDPADLAVLLELLAAVGVVDCDGDRWSLPPVAERFLVSSSPASMVELVRRSPGVHRAWPALATTLRAGAPSEDLLAATEQLYPALVAATAPTQRAVAAAVAVELAPPPGAAGHRPVVVDLGCGSGAWLATLVASFGPDARGVGVDLPAVIGSIAASVGPPAIALVAGDYLAVDLSVDPADVVVLAHVLRAETEQRAEALVARAIGLLRPGGVLVVTDYFGPGPDRTTDDYRMARHDLTLALTMRAGTRGRGLTTAQLDRWCDRHGAEPAGVLEPVPRQLVRLYRRPTPRSKETSP